MWGGQAKVKGTLNVKWVKKEVGVKVTSLLQRLAKSVPRNPGLIQLHLPWQASLDPGLLLCPPTRHLQDLAAAVSGLAHTAWPCIPA